MHYSHHHRYLQRQIRLVCHIYKSPAQKKAISSSFHPILVKHSRTTLSSGGGPQNNSISSPAPLGGPASLSNSSAPMNPLPPAQPSCGFESVWKMRHFSGPAPAASASISARHRMSTSVLLPSRTTQRGISWGGSRITARRTAKTGVTPLPPQTMTNLLMFLVLPDTENCPLPRYSKRPTGPLNSTQWPSGIESSAVVIRPPGRFPLAR